MSQQFLSKYFSPVASSSASKEKSDGSAPSRPSSRSSRPAFSGGKAISKCRNGGKRKAVRDSASSNKHAGGSSGWECKQCTFQNVSAAAVDCGTCGRRRVSTGASASSEPVIEEIELSSSDNDGIDDDIPGSEELSIGRERKRKKPACGDTEAIKGINGKGIKGKGGKGKGEPTPDARRLPQATTPPHASEEGRGNRGRFQQGQPKKSDESPEGESTPPMAMDAHEKLDGGVQGAGLNHAGAPQWKTPPSRSADAATAGEIVITADSFDLRENLSRRKEFQAGVQATLRDDDNGGDPCYEAPRMGGDGCRMGKGGDVHGAEGANATARAGREASSESSAATVHGRENGKGRGKGKGKGKGNGGVANSGVKLTPMEQQVSDLKVQHPGMLLLIECGYRFRFFGEDALAAAKVLQIYAHVDRNFHVASVPCFRLAVHLRRLVDAGYKVGVVRQVESAALKAAGLTESGKKSGTFKRELVAVFTQATWMEGAVEALVPPSSSNGGASAAEGTDAAGKKGGGKGQGSWRKIGGVWRRVGGWGGGKREEEAGGAEHGGGGGPKEEGTGGSTASEADMAAPLPQVDHQRSEQWLLSIYEEAVSSPDAPHGEPLSISLALAGAGEGEDTVGMVRVGLIAVDVRTGKVVHDAFVESSGQRQELDTRLRHLRPLELLAPGPRLSKATEATLTRYCQSAVDARGDKRVVRTERLPPEEFCFDVAQTSLKEFLDNHTCNTTRAAGKEAGSEVSTITRLLDLPRPAICALGPLMTHLERFGLDRALASPDVASFSQSQYMTLDAVTLRDLEVLQCQADGREAGSLFSILDHSQTSFGRRVLSGWLRQPLLSVQDITARQDAVEELVTDPPSITEHLRPLLRDMKDLDPAVASLHHRKIKPSRLLSLLGIMRKVVGVFQPPLGGAVAGGGTDVGDAEGGTNAHQAAGRASSAELREAIAGVPASYLAPMIGRYLGQIDPQASASDDYVRALVDGESFCGALARAAEDEEAALAGLGKELQAVRGTLRKPSLQWKSLRTGVSSSVEYLVELRKGEAKKLAPSKWIQVSQTKDLVRFHTPEVLRLQQELLQARESRNIAARQAWAEFVRQVDDDCYQGFRNAVQALGKLDALLSLAAVAKLPGYVRPVYCHRDSQGGVRGGDSGHVADTREPEGDQRLRSGDRVDAIVLRGARHPTVERVLEGGFVPNDVDLRSGECLVVTGPNMGGKSSTVRMVAMLCIMGQMGSYVPADSAEMYCLDGVYTRMGAGDDLAADMSTFMVELWHTSYILKNATRRSLVVLDELGRGTSTHDGVAIALATLKHLVKDLKCSTLFVTHYPQVANLALEPTLSGLVKNAHMSFIDDQIEDWTTRAEEQAAHGVDRAATAGDREGPHEERRKAEAHGLTFLYRLVVGQAHRSYGLNVARAAGMDEDMIELASKMSAKMRSSWSSDKISTSTSAEDFMDEGIISLLRRLSVLGTVARVAL